MFFFLFKAASTICSLVVYAFRRGWISDTVPSDLCVMSFTLQEEGVKEKSSTCKTCHQMPYSDPTARPPWSAWLLMRSADSQAPPPGVSTEMGEEGELTLETERQMVRPCASAQQHEDLPRVVEVYQSREVFLCLL